MTVTEGIERIEQRLATPDQWGQGKFALDKDGNDVAVMDSRAVKFCLIGAIDTTFGIGNPLREKVLGYIRPVIWQKCHDLRMTISVFNDFPSTTHSDVLDVLSKAKRRSESDASQGQDSQQPR